MYCGSRTPRRVGILQTRLADDTEQAFAFEAPHAGRYEVPMQTPPDPAIEVRWPTYSAHLGVLKLKGIQYLLHYTLSSLPGMDAKSFRLAAAHRLTQADGHRVYQCS